MSLHISKSEFKAKALEYFRLIESNKESIVVTDKGVPKLEIRPYQKPEANPLLLLKGTVAHYDAPTDPVGDNEWAANN